LAQLNKSNAKKTLFSAEAGLAERAGKDERAIAALNRLIQHYPPVEESWLLRRAALFYQRGDIVQAWQSLTEVEKKMPD
jgi:Flp pilus assembly protein TadD